MASITAVPTSTALFVDPTAKAPVRLASGRGCGKAIELFFVNGGREAYVGALQHLDELPDVALLVMPGVTDVERINEALAVCEQSGRCFLVADPPEGRVRESSYGAIYGPALLVNGASVPASGAVAGVYARLDASRGVWRAPAGSEATVAGIDGVTEAIEQSNDFNVIRTFPAIGTVVWGARTIARNDPEWRYVPLRRLAILISESIRRGLQWAVFEPNDENTWSAVRQMVSNFLFGLWKQGALVGNKPEDAFTVRAGAGSTMTAQDIADGRLRVTVLFAPLQPAEFVVLDFTQAMQQQP